VVPEVVVPEVVPEVAVEEPTEEPTEGVPVTKSPAKASPTATPSPTPSASASSSETAEAVAIERSDSRQGPNVPLLALLSVVIVGCLAGLVKLVGLPGDSSAHGPSNGLPTRAGRVSAHSVGTLYRGRRERP
jgi:hypothetical protein